MLNALKNIVKKNRIARARKKLEKKALSKPTKHTIFIHEMSADVHLYI